MKIFDNKHDMLIETKIKPNIKMIYEMKVNGLSDKYIAQGIGISEPMFQKLMAKSELLKDTYDDAMMILSSKLNDVVISRALGTDGKRDVRGTLVGPDSNLAFRLLEKFDKRYSSKIEVTETITIESVIKQISSEKKEVELVEHE